MIALSGLLVLGAAQVAAAQEPANPVPSPSAPIAPANPVPSPSAPIAPANPVPSPSAPITPATGGVITPQAPEDAAPVAQPPAEAGSEAHSNAPIEAVTPTPAETLPATPAPAPYGTAPGGAAPTPYPAPGAAPAGSSGFDFGGEMMTPLPPPPPSLNPSTISRGPWRGRGWIGLRMSVTGPVGGELGARPGVLSLGGGGDVGWRINNVLGLGMGLSGQIHGRTRVREVGTNDTVRFNNGMLYWDAAFLRVYMPLKRRFQPYAEIGGGLARLKHHAPDATGTIVDVRSYGAQMRAALGIEGWVSSTVTIGFSGTYRMNAFRELPGHGPGWTIGHAMQGVIELGLHW